jgi:methenyltetrahydrofolate cyclohydrolase
VLGTGIDEWLERLGSSASTPGGGAAAALAAAMGAALVEMVVNLTLGRPAYAEHEEHVRRIGEGAGALRRLALELVAADEAAFEAVTAAYRLPKGTDEERAARAAAIQAATAAAADPPLRVAETAARVIGLSAELPDRSNRNVLSDVGVAASLAVSALESAAINVEVNLAALRDAAARERLRRELEGHLEAIGRGRQLVMSVRGSLGD